VKIYIPRVYGMRTADAYNTGDLGLVSGNLAPVSLDPILQNQQSLMEHSNHMGHGYGGRYETLRPARLDCQVQSSCHVHLTMVSWSRVVTSLVIANLLRSMDVYVIVEKKWSDKANSRGDLLCSLMLSSSNLGCSMTLS
jgi:hypothetical protein